VNYGAAVTELDVDRVEEALATGRGRRQKRSHSWLRSSTSTPPRSRASESSLLARGQPVRQAQVTRELRSRPHKLEIGQRLHSRAVRLLEIVRLDSGCRHRGDRTDLLYR
jgi:hypothetical protein